MKIIPQLENKIIGWKGNLLEIGLIENSVSYVRYFLSIYLAINTSAIIVIPKGEYYEAILHTKYEENVETLFT